MKGERDMANVINLLSICGIINTAKGFAGKIVFSVNVLRVLIVLLGCIMCNISVFLFGIKKSIPRFGFMCISGMFISIHTLYFWRQRRGIKKTIYSIKALLQKRDESRHIEYFKKYSAPSWIILNALLTVTTIVIMLYFNTPLIYDAYLALFTSSTEPFSLPLPNVGLLGTENPKRSFWYYFVTLFLTVWVHFLSITTFCFFLLLYIPITYFCVELQIISDNIITWGNSYKKFGSSKEWRASVKSILYDHQQALRLAAGIREIIGLPFFIYYIFGPVCMTLFTYSFMVNLKKQLMLALFNLICLISLVSLLFLSCLAGEMLQSQSLKIFESLCNIPWYEMPPKIRKDLNLIVLQSVRPMTIHYKRRAYLNLKTFMQMLNSFYSYFMLLNSMR